MKLFYAPGACSLACHLALRESGIPFSAESVHLNTLLFKTGDLRTITDKCYVPALQLDNGEVLTEVSVVLQYIADHVPKTHLIPKYGTMEHYRAQEWLNYIATEIHKGFGPLWSDTYPEDIKRATRQSLKEKFDYISKHLKGKTFLMGDTYTVVDSYLFTMLYWCHFLKFNLTDWSLLVAYFDHIQSRPTTLEILKIEGLLK